MNILIKILFIFFLLKSNLINSGETSKILFSINEKPYTTIDIEQRILYLNMITNNEIKLSNNEIINDFIEVLIFNEFAKEKNIKINDEIINDFLVNINNSNFNKEIESYLYENNQNNFVNLIIKNIAYDYQRKLVLEKLIRSKNIEYNTLKSINYNDIFNLNIEYLLIEKNKDLILEEKINFKEFHEMSNFENNLKNNSIKYTYHLKERINIDKINPFIKKAILNKKNKFFVNEDKYLIYGFIERKLKENIDLNYSFYQIIPKTNIKLDESMIDCNKINEIKNSNDFKIKNFENISINKLNDVIKDNLRFINQFILINNQNQNSIVLLCDIQYDNKMLEQLNVDSKFNKEVNEIEREFIYQNKIKYKFKSYE